LRKEHVMTDSGPVLNLGSAGKSIARRLAEGIRAALNRGEDDGTACGARVPHPSGPSPAGAVVSLAVTGNTVMSDEDVCRLIDSIGRKLRRGGGEALAGIR
jgi:hypothetical protein